MRRVEISILKSDQILSDARMELIFLRLSRQIHEHHSWLDLVLLINGVLIVHIFKEGSLPTLSGSHDNAIVREAREQCEVKVNHFGIFRVDEDLILKRLISQIRKLVSQIILLQLFHFDIWIEIRK